MDKKIKTLKWCYEEHNKYYGRIDGQYHYELLFKIIERIKINDYYENFSEYFIYINDDYIFCLSSLEESKKYCQEYLEKIVSEFYE